MQADEAQAEEAQAEEAQAEEAQAAQAPVASSAATSTELQAAEPATVEPAAAEPTAAEPTNALHAARVRLQAAEDTLKQCRCKEKIAEAEAAQRALAELEEKERRKGFWTDRALNLGVTASGLYNQSFVGQVDGLAGQLGAVVDGGLALGYGPHIWRSSLKLTEGLLAVPTDAGPLQPIVVKAADELLLTSEYRFRWDAFPWIGPYAQVGVQTQLFQSAFTARESALLRRTYRDGTVEDLQVAPGKSVTLSDILEPFVFTESVGAAFEAPRLDKWLISGFKLGATGQHLLVRDGFVLADDPETPEVEAKQLVGSSSFGIEAEAQLSGQLSEAATWALLARVYEPVIVVEETELDALERLHVDLAATVSFKLLEWLSVDWVSKVRRQPFILEDWQVQSSLLLSAGFNVL